MRILTLITAVLALTACTTEDNFGDKYNNAYCKRSEACNPEQECEPEESNEEDDTDQPDEEESDYVFNRDKANECLSEFKNAECVDFLGATLVVPPDACFELYERAE